MISGISKPFSIISSVSDEISEWPDKEHQSSKHKRNSIPYCIKHVAFFAYCTESANAKVSSSLPTKLNASHTYKLSAMLHVQCIWGGADRRKVKFYNLHALGKLVPYFVL